MNSERISERAVSKTEKVGKVIAEMVAELFRDMEPGYGMSSERMSRQPGMCNDATHFIMHRFENRFPNVTMKRMKGLEDQGILQSGKKNRQHIFAEIDLENETWVLDATWQQFLPPEHQAPEKPLALWVRKTELGPELTRLGVPLDLHRIWTSAYPAPSEY